MKNKITTCSLFLIVFFVFFLFFFYCPYHLQAEGIPEIWSASIKTNGPTAIALDVYENLYIVEAGRNHLLVYSSDGKYLKRLSVLDKPISVAVDSNGRIFIGNAGRGNVEVFDADRNPLFKLGAGDGEFKQPTGIAVDSTGSIYMADGKEDKIKVYNPDGSSKFSFGASGNGDGRFNYPTSIAIDEQAGEIIVSDLQVQVIESRSIGAARVQFFDMEGGYIRSFGDFGVGEGLLMKPLGVAVDTESRIYVTDAYQNVVQVFDNNGNFLKMLYDSDNPLRTPMDIAIGKETNRLFIASLNTASVEIYKEPGDNEPPTAYAGPDQTLYEGDAVTLDGSGSTDPDGSIASYLWAQTDGPSVTLSDATEVQSAFTAPDVGPGGEALSFQLTVTDNGGLQSTDTCIVNVSWSVTLENAHPTANAGSDQTLYEGDAVMLDGSGSTDPDDGIASYFWEQTDGIPVTLSDTTAIQPSFTAPDVGLGGEALRFQLTVTDNGGLQSTDTCIVNVSWGNVPPTAYAGPDQTVDEGDAALLDGSNSTDPDDGIASYFWEQTGGEPVTLSGATEVQPTFNAPDVGPGGEALSFQLTVTDNGGLQSADICIVNVTWENDSPTAYAGPDQTVDEGDAVLLDGSNSIDPDDGIASYFWEQTGGIPVTLSDTTVFQPTFNAPDVGQSGESLSFQLTVTDNGGLQSTDTCIVNVTWGNVPPTAYAGPDQTVDEGDAVTLDGSGSTDPDDGIASHFWEQTGGTPVTLSGATSVQPTFNASDVGQSGESLSFQLTVTDNGGLQSTDTCIVNIPWINEPPTADAAGPDQTVNEGFTVTLDDSGSTDPDDGIASYLWVQTDGTPVTLSDPTVSQPTFVAPPVVSGGTLTVTFQLTVTDNGGLKDTDEVLVTINDNGITGFPDDVITLESSPGENIGIREDSSGNITSLNVVDPDTIEGAANRPQNFIYGLLEMQIKVPIAGDTATVKVYLPNPAPEGYKWYKYNLDDGWIDFSRDVISGGLGDGAEFNEDRTEVTLYITDNSDYDDDPRGGIIKDPSGIGIAPVGNGGDGGGSSGDSEGGGGGCFIALLSPVYQTEAGGKGTPPSTLNSTPNSIPKEEAKLSKEEQQKRAIEVFHNIFELSRVKERAANLEQMIALYYRIINQYPDVPLAQESYWRLIEMFFKDFNPPQKDKALSLYNEYRGRYPDSPLRNAVEGTITRSLYLNGYWNELLVFASPGGEEFKDPQKLKSPLTMFYYSEAKFRLNDFKEAFRGYEVIVKYFPDSRMAGTAIKRMAEINREKNESNRNHLLKVGRR